MLERVCNPHGSSKQASTPGRVQAREHLSRASKSARVQGANHRFKDCRQIELATEASKNERVQTTDSDTIDTVKLSGCCVYEEAVVLLNPGQEEIARALLCLKPGANCCCCH